MSINNFLAILCAARYLNGKEKSAEFILRGKGVAGIIVNSMPRLGTISFSKPLSVPMIKTCDWESKSLIAFAQAIAGSICPAVPPAARAMTVI